MARHSRKVQQGVTSFGGRIDVSSMPERVLQSRCGTSSAVHSFCILLVLRPAAYVKMRAVVGDSVIVDCGAVVAGEDTAKLSFDVVPQMLRRVVCSEDVAVESA